MVSKDSVRRSQSVPASKPVSKTFVIIAITIAVLVVLGVFLLLTKGQFVGKAISFSQVAQQAPSTTQTEPSTQLVQQAPSTESTTTTETTQQEVLPGGTSSLPSTTSTTPSSSDDLQIDLELNRVNRTHSWVNVYLTSASHDQIAQFSPLRLVSKNKFTGEFVKVEMQPLFKLVKTDIKNAETLDFSLVDFSGMGPFPITPLAKTYIGRVYLKNINDVVGTTQIALHPDSRVFYDSSNKFILSIAPLSACAPGSQTLAPSVEACGYDNDGCGGFLNYGSCAEGLVCVNNACQSAVSLVLQANAPQYDKTVLEQVSTTLSNQNLGKLQKLSAIVNAVKAWLAAQ
ncbi:hypothetical protein HY494_00445 [Candidatus Woesearchaeota archaeon]|nr:hypothetical protein [Candidatus Woesearchaeota archaeon]